MSGSANGAVPPVEVVLTDRAEDLDEALGLIHDGFVEAGYVAPLPSGRRMHPSYLNPGTFFALARSGGQTVGVCNIVCDGPFGLPSDRAFAEENDAVRAAADAPLRECGSLVVRSEWRRHTRHVFTKLLGALVRAQQAEFFASPVMFAVAPESERFHRGVFSAELVAGPRPLYGEPAVLLLTHGLRMREGMAAGGGPGRRAVARLALERHPGWLSDRRRFVPPPPEWFLPLLDEQGYLDRMSAQLSLLSPFRPPAASPRRAARARVTALAPRGGGRVPHTRRGGCR